ncbi:hypothetical protein [uncultured Muribaculum sp.]|uniref:hypothetical protein n=1 Tax=uncultured Muribaculum sp. TaxID=1918613 RepID=UPI0026704CE6|nr:hypothetical protein [uncultured Muribaculum sp.]
MRGLAGLMLLSVGYWPEAIHVYNTDVGCRADIVGEPRIYEGMYLVGVPYAKTTWICIAWRLFVWMVTAGLCVFGHG